MRRGTALWLSVARQPRGRGAHPITVLRLYRRALREARRCPTDDKRHEVTFYARHMIDTNRHAFPDQAQAQLRQGEEDLERFVYFLDLKQQATADDHEIHLREPTSSATRDAPTVESPAGNAPPRAAVSPEARVPVKGRDPYAEMASLLAVARASHHLPSLQAAEIGDDMIHLVRENVLSLAQFEAALEKAGVPIGPRVAILATLERALDD